MQRGRCNEKSLPPWIEFDQNSKKITAEDTDTRSRLKSRTMDIFTMNNKQDEVARLRISLDFKDEYTTQGFHKMLI